MDTERFEDVYPRPALFREFVSEIQKRYAITNNNLSRGSGIKPSRLSRIILGLINPSLEEAENIVKCLEEIEAENIAESLEESKHSMKTYDPQRRAHIMDAVNKGYSRGDALVYAKIRQGREKAEESKREKSKPRKSGVLAKRVYRLGQASNSEDKLSDRP